MAADRLPRLPKGVRLVNADGSATDALQRWWQAVVERVESRLGALELQLIEDALDTVSEAVITVQAGVDAVAGAAADAQAAADQIANASALADSYVEGCTITSHAAAGTITISAHTRRYADGTSVSVNSGTLSSISYDIDAYIFYDQPSRAGGAVTYAYTTTPGDAVYSVAHPNRHYVGSVHTALSSGDPDRTGFKVDPSVVLPPYIGP